MIRICSRSVVTNLLLNHLFVGFEFSACAVSEKLMASRLGTISAVVKCYNKGSKSMICSVEAAL